MKINEDIATDAPAWAHMLNLAAEKLGAMALYATDDFFAEKENLLKPGRGIFIHDKYTDRGKWMDGWDSRRKRVPGHECAEGVLRKALRPRRRRCNAPTVSW